MLGDFYVENFPIFPIRKVPGNVLKTLLWGPKTIRKKYWVVFEIFLKSMFFSAFSENIVTRFLSGKISDFSNSETSKRCLQKSSVGTRNNQKKILSTFWDIPKNHVFSAFQNGTSVLPSIQAADAACCEELPRYPGGAHGLRCANFQIKLRRWKFFH